ncbi:MAG: nickel pincer cofactor biosynthesis protein LarB [Acidobacteriota bacterium]
MKPDRMLELLREVAAGKLAVESALDRLKALPFRDLGFARLDTQRPLRTGHAEAVFGAGKTPEQLLEIVEAMAEDSQPVLVTRLSPAARDTLAERFPQASFDEDAGCMVLGTPPPAKGMVAVLSAGTADLPVAAEAAVTAETMGSAVARFWDVGVAGLQRLLAVCEEVAAARAIVVVAGMEGALPSVVGGMVRAPVIAVPTSVGYGASFGGLTALLSMLNSCAPGVATVNIDNGFGGGYLAHLINAGAEQIGRR